LNNRTSNLPGSHEKSYALVHVPLMRFSLPTSSSAAKKLASLLFDIDMEAKENGTWDSHTYG